MSDDEHGHQAPRRTETTKHWLDYVTTLLVAGGFAASAWSALNGTRQFVLAQRSQEINDRAWLQPKNIKISWRRWGGDPDPRHADLNMYAMDFQIENIGKTPALKVTSAAAIKPMPHVGAIAPNHFLAGPNTTCPSMADQTVAYPKSLINAASTVFFTKPNADAPSGYWLTVIQGCVAYDTLGKRHISKFCIFLSPEPESTAIDERQILPCADGQEAD